VSEDEDDLRKERRKLFIAGLRKRYPSIFPDPRAIEAPREVSIDTLSDLYRKTPCAPLSGMRQSEASE
jgi:hypothetical protein